MKEYLEMLEGGSVMRYSVHLIRPEPYDAQAKGRFIRIKHTQLRFFVAEETIQRDADLRLRVRMARVDAQEENRRAFMDWLESKPQKEPDALIKWLECDEPQTPE